MTLLRSVSVNLAELRRAQTRVGKEDWGLGIGERMAFGCLRGVEGKIFANEVIQITLKNRV